MKLSDKPSPSDAAHPNRTRLRCVTLEDEIPIVTYENGRSDHAKQFHDAILNTLPPEKLEEINKQEEEKKKKQQEDLGKVFGEFAEEKAPVTKDPEELPEGKKPPRRFIY